MIVRKAHDTLAYYCMNKTNFGDSKCMCVLCVFASLLSHATYVI